MAALFKDFTQSVKSEILDVNSNASDFIRWWSKIRQNIITQCSKDIFELSNVQNKVAMLIIGANMSSKLRQQISDCDTAVQVWKTLSERFKCTQSLLVTTIEQLYSIQPQIGLMEQFFNKLEQYFMVIMFYDSNLITDKFKCLLVLSKLPIRYHLFRGVYVNIDTFKYDYIKSSILKVDKQNVPSESKNQLSEHLETIDAKNDPNHSVNFNIKSEKSFEKPKENNINFESNDNINKKKND